MNESRTRHQVFVAGGTGYIGRQLIPQLLQRGHEVRTLVRKGSEHKLPPGCTPAVGNALEKASFTKHVEPADTYVQLVGVSHPSPAKAKEFETVDLASARASITAAKESGVVHFIYVSVAHPAPAMKAYITVRVKCEGMLRQSGLNATILRPWYVLGPGHRWPYILVPTYWLCERIPGTREGARRLGLVTMKQMIGALVWAVENRCEPEDGRNQCTRVLAVPEIKQFGS